MKPLSAEAVRSYKSNGYVVLENYLLDADLGMLRATCDKLLKEPPDDDKGGAAHNIGRGNDRRFLRHRHEDIQALADWVLGSDMKKLASNFVGANPYLFNEQFVVKGPRTGASFAWHQDSAYVGFDHKPYVSFWMALDDTNADNGAVFLLPQDLCEGAVIVPHEWDTDGKEMIGYSGNDPGIAAIVPAGSIVVFSSLTLHCSSPNTTDMTRRAYLAQFSSEPIIDPATNELRIFAKRL